MIPRVGEAVRSDQSYTLRPGVYAMLLRGSNVLLTHQSEPEPETQLPGGGIDPGEQPLAALHREILEETGWTISKPKRVGAYRRFTYMPDYSLWAEKLCTIYLARPARQVGRPSEAHHTAIWTPLSEAVDILDTPGDREFMAVLQDALASR